MSETQGLSDFEALLVQESAITAAQLERARRIAAHLQRPRRPTDVLIEMGQLARAEYERVLRKHRSLLSIASILREDGALDDVTLEIFQTDRLARPGATERELLVDSGRVTEEQFLRALSVRHGVPFVEPEAGLVDTKVLARASYPYLIRKRVLPLYIGDDELTAIMADPLDQEVLGELERIYRVKVRPCCATAEKIVGTLKVLEGLRDGHSTLVQGSLQYREIEEQTGPNDAGEGAVAILDHLILRAIQLRASDLHVEPQDSSVRVRVRVDGVLQILTTLPATFAPQLVSRVKVLAGCDIAEKRRHQDGRIRVRVEGREVDIRVASYVTTHGESVVMRLLDTRRGMVPIEELGFETRIFGTLRDVVLRNSSGLILITGPTGSGKTTTLYSFVDFINDPTIKTISCEDPVEYMIEGVSQCSVNQKTGPTFADSLRAIVRQDPDVVVVGEVRDPDTASLAVEAALTGHQVFSTFHTEDAVGAVVRLTEMGVLPYLIASTLTCVVAQRLVRRVCEACRAPAQPSREDLRFLGLERGDLAGVNLVRGGGCTRCGGTGFHGRAGIHEVLLPDDDFRDAVMHQAPSKVLRGLARKLPGFFTLQEDGLLKAAAGVTTLSEVVGNAPRDAAARKPAQLREMIGRNR